MTNAPKLDKSFTAMLPTPPVAPLTTIFEESSENCCSIFAKHSPAVRPAVPIIMQSLVVRVSGHLMAHSLGTRTYSANPPFVFTPRSKPVTITFVPKGKLEFSDLVYDYRVEQMSNLITIYKILYNGTPDKFISNFSEKFQLDISKEVWEIK